LTRKIFVVAVPLLAVALVATRYNQNWYFYDEWSMIHRVLVTRHHILQGATLSYNGHFYLIAYFVYKAQLALGLSQHVLIWAIFCSTLVALNVSVALVLWAGGVPSSVAIIAGVVMAYFGPGAELMTFEINFTMDAAIALPIFAGFFVLHANDRRASVAIIATLLLLAVVFDSATAFAGLAFVAVLLLLRWRDRWALVALLPAAIVGGIFTLAQDASLTTPATPGQQTLFGVRLLLRAFGGLVGGTQLAGAIALATGASALIWVLCKRALEPTTASLVTAGLASGLLMVAITAWARAGLVKDDFFDFNRYISLAAVYLLLALLPTAVVAARALGRVGTRGLEPVLGCLLAVVFLLNLRPLMHYRTTIETWMAQTHSLVQHVTWVMSRGCPLGHSLNLSAEPLGTLDPQVTVGLLRQLETVGALKPPSHQPPRVPVVAPTAWNSAAAAVCS
jgi:hypothetical protein